MAANAQVQSQRLDEVFKRFEASRDEDASLGLLEQLLTMAHGLDTRDLIETLRHSPTLDPSLRRYLPEAIGKLGRYNQIVVNLTNAARTTKHSLFHNIVVVAVQYNQMDTLMPETGLRDFDAAWSRVTGKSARGRSSSVEMNTRKKYDSRVSNHDTRWKVHAEIQILLFYELNPQRLPPRIICASKSACYLCDLFFQIHGKFEVPRTHGRIYEKWALPDWSPRQCEIVQSIIPIVERFNHALEGTIRTLVGQKMTRHPPPNESVVGIYQPWSSYSTICPETPATPDPVRPSVPRIDLQNDGSRSQPCCSLHEYGVEDSSHPRRSFTPSVSTPPTGPSSDRTGSTLSLVVGEQITKDVSDGKLFHVHTSTIHFEISIAGDRDDSADKELDLPCTCLVVMNHSRSGSKVLNDAEVYIVDLDALRPGHDIIVPAGIALPLSRMVFCSKGQEVVLWFEASALSSIHNNCGPLVERTRSGDEKAC